MRTKEEILKANVFGELKGQLGPIALKSMQEWGEEYAKALLHSVLTKPHESNTYEQIIADFNKSLKE